ncbi:IS481 family transposase [Corynebacterium aquilae]|uniref:IS481 family transposase n=1 Tax=Corynebacterium aquilae TaxID=203263 RepID=UPI001FE40E21|nr:IS481 family transposase [Corynebacterium aquilae]
MNIPQKPRRNTTYNRNKAIIVRHRNGQSVTAIAKALNLSRQTIYTILRAYEQHGEQGLKPQSTRPHTSPQRTTPTTITRIINLRRTLTQQGLDAGPETIRWHLIQQGHHAPAASTIHRILTKEGLVTPHPKRRPKSSYIRFQAELPNECWQLDVTEYPLKDGTKAEILDCIDDYSRLIIGAQAYPVVTGPIVVAFVTRAFDTYGLPQSTLTDNGMVFTSRLTGSPGTRNGFEQLLYKHHIKQKNGRPGHLQTQGKIERWHQTFKKALKAKPPAETIEQLQHQIDEVVEEYNTRRPHKSLGRTIPMKVYTSAPKAVPDPTYDPDTDHRIRTDIVDASGKCTLRHAGKLLKLGIGRSWRHTPITIIIADQDTTVVETSTGTIIARHSLDPTKQYQTPYEKYPPPPGRPIPGPKKPKNPGYRTKSVSVSMFFQVLTCDKGVFHLLTRS